MSARRGARSIFSNCGTSSGTSASTALRPDGDGGSMLKIGFLHSVIRKDEKLLLDELQSRPGIEVVMIDDRMLTFTLGRNGFGVDVVLERSINHSRALYALRLFEAVGIPCVNQSRVATV